MRGAVWCRLLQIEKVKAAQNGQLYMKLVYMDNPELELAIKNDQIATRSNLNYKDQSTYTPDSTKLSNIIKAYGNLDVGLSYSQGYNFIVSLLLRFIEDEEDAFWCLLMIMSNMNWRECFLAD